MGSTTYVLIKIEVIWNPRENNKFYTYWDICPFCHKYCSLLFVLSVVTVRHSLLCLDIDLNIDNRYGAAISRCWLSPGVLLSDCPRHQPTPVLFSFPFALAATHFRWEPLRSPETSCHFLTSAASAFTDRKLSPLRPLYTPSSELS